MRGHIEALRQLQLLLWLQSIPRNQMRGHIEAFILLVGVLAVSATFRAIKCAVTLKRASALATAAGSVAFRAIKCAVTLKH